MLKFLRCWHLYLLAAFSLGMAGETYAVPFVYTFTALPESGNLDALPGATVGWGYRIVNEDPTNWLVVTALSADAVQQGTPDASIFDYPIVAPGATAELAFDDLTDAGLFRFTWNGSAPSGFANVGVFTLGGEWWSDDPFGAGAFVQAAAFLTSPFSVTVTPNGIIAEPSPSWLIASLLPFFLLGMRKRLPD